MNPKEKYPLISKANEVDLKVDNSGMNRYNSLLEDRAIAMELYDLMEEKFALEKKGYINDLEYYKELRGMWEKFAMTDTFHFMRNNLYANGYDWREIKGGEDEEV